MGYTTAKDWLNRFVKAGCRIELDEVTMRPIPGFDSPMLCCILWQELKGPQNEEKWNEVLAQVKARVGPIRGWEYYPVESQDGDGVGVSLQK